MLLFLCAQPPIVHTQLPAIRVDRVGGVLEIEQEYGAKRSVVEAQLSARDQQAAHFRGITMA